MENVFIFIVYTIMVILVLGVLEFILAYRVLNTGDVEENTKTVQEVLDWLKNTKGWIVPEDNSVLLFRGFMEVSLKDRIMITSNVLKNPNTTLVAGLNVVLEDDFKYLGIRIYGRIRRKKFVELLIHELRHYNQFYNDNENTKYWRDSFVKVHKGLMDYRTSPHEVDARKVAAEVTKEFLAYTS